MSRAWYCFLAAVLLAVPVPVLAQGLLVDVEPGHHYRLPRPPFPPYPWPGPRPPVEPPQSYKIQELVVQAAITDQIAKVQVTQSFVNTGSRPMEVCFIFPLPYDGAVDQMTFMVDGREYEAKLLGADEARRIYEGYIRRNQDPALLEWLGTGMFKTSVFPVPPGVKRTVSMRYTQVCRTSSGLTEWLFPLSTAKYTSHPVETVKLEITLQSQAAIKNIYSPTHPLDVSRPTPHSARITSTSTQSVPTTDFRLLYDVGDQPLAASVLSYRPDSGDDGYFLLLVSPDIPPVSEPALPKTVLFVVDRSGSMSGKKIEQAKGALRFVLNNLREQDLFNIVAYDSAVESFRPELQRYTPETRSEALGYIESLYAGGSTNIHGALQTALAQLADASRPTYVVFLTDGLPTAGERREPQIVAAAREANKVRARLFVLGVGYDVNSRLLDRLARECFGQSQYVLPDEDLEAHVAKLYGRIGAPALVDVKLSVDVEQMAPEQGAAISRIYPRDTRDLFAGDQLVLVGRYKQPGAAKVTIRGQANGQEQAFRFPATLVDKSLDDSYAFIAKLWAIRRVGEIIDEIDLHGKNQELVNELVALATRHGILTPYTSFLADETTNVRDVAAAQTFTDRALYGLSEEAGKSAFDQRVVKSQLQRESVVPLGGYAPGSGLAAGMGGAGLAYPALPGAAPGDAAGSGVPERRAAVAGRGAGLPGGVGGAATGPAGGPEVTNVLYIGPKTFFRRGQRWEDSALTEEHLRRVERIERYSDAYFALLERHGKDVAKYLALEGQVVVVLGDQAYEF